MFGGTFDPPHVGHLEAVRGLFENPGAREVWVLPASIPPQKKSLATSEQRVEMTKIVFSDTKDVKVDLREIERGKRNPAAPSYSFDTLNEICQEVSRLAFVIGNDQLRDLHSWYRFPELLGLCHWVVLARKPDGMALVYSILQEWRGSGLALPRGNDCWQLKGGSYLRAVLTEAPDVSSTSIRQQISRTGELPEESIPIKLINYLNIHRIYGNRKKEEREEIE